MNQFVDYTQPGVMWFDQDVLKHMQGGYMALLDGLAGHFGDKVIVSGVANTNGTISDGWVSYGGEILPFSGGGQQPYVDVLITTGDVQYDDNTLKPVLKSKKLVMVLLATGTSFPFADLVRPGVYKNQWSKGDIKHHKCNAAYIAANFDPSTWEALTTSEQYGWKIDLDAGGRVIMGWHPSSVDPGSDPAWSADANLIGNKFGERLHQLLVAELPVHSHVIPGSIAGNFGGSGAVPAVANTGPEPAGSTNNAGNGQPHNNIQPSIVYLILEKL